MFSSLRKLRSSALYVLLFRSKKQNIARVVGAIFCNICSALLEIASYACFLVAFSAYEGKGTRAQKYLAMWGVELSPEYFFLGSVLLAVTALIGKNSAGYISHRLSNAFSSFVQQEVTAALYDKVFAYSFSHIASKKAGVLIENVRKPLTFIVHIINQANMTMVHGFMVIFCFSLMLLLSPPLTCVTVLTMLFIGALYKVMLKKVKSISKAALSESEELTSHISQNVGAARLVHLYELRRHTRKKLLPHLQGVVQKNIEYQEAMFRAKALIEFLGISMIALCLVLGRFFFATELSLSVMFAYLGISYRLAGNVNGFLSGIGQLAYYVGDYTSIEKMLRHSEKEERREGGSVLKGEFASLAIKELSFTYPSKEHQALSELSLTIQAGKTYALVGSSGAGKSTFADLLLGLYEPTHGEILVNGTPLSSMDIEKYRSHFGVVSQETQLFHDTLRENICLGRAVDEEVLSRVCKMAQIETFIQKMPQGLDTVIGDRGHKLSGGERQRVALARALLRNPDIFLFDEATSSLDSKTEKAIQESIVAMHGKKTIIIIAHRLSTITHADVIFHFDHGRCVEEGSLSALLSAKGKFAQLWEIQRHKGKRELVATSSN